MDTSFTQGTSVMYRGHGIGKVIGTELKGPPGEQQICLVVGFGSGMTAFMPVERASTVVRHLCTPTEAESDLQVLRAAEIDAEPKGAREKADTRDRTLRSGTRVEITTLLRRLYSLKGPVSERDGRAIKNLEDLVLGEISIVLGIPRETLENEMRDRYPVFADKKKRA